MNQALLPLAQHALALPLGSDVLAALTVAPGSRGALSQRLLSTLPLPLDRRSLLPLLAACGLGQELPSGHAGFRLLQASAMHERARLAEIDRVVQPLLDQISRDGLPMQVIGAYELARYYPERAWRHVHNLIILCPNNIEDAALLRRFGFNPASNPAAMPGSKLFTHTNGFELRLTGSPLPPSFPAPIAAGILQRIMSDGRVSPEVACLLCLATLMTAQPAAAAMALADLYFILKQAASIDSVFSMAKQNGLVLPMYVALCQIGKFPPHHDYINNLQVDYSISVSASAASDEWLTELLLRLCLRRSESSLLRLVIETKNWKARQAIIFTLSKLAAKKTGLRMERTRDA